MRIEIVQAISVDELRQYTFTEVAECSGLSEADLRVLTEAGVFEPLEASAQPSVFSGTTVRLAQTARRLRDDFELDVPAVAVAVQLVSRIRELEEQLKSFKARMSRQMR